MLVTSASSIRSRASSATSPRFLTLCTLFSCRMSRLPDTQRLDAGRSHGRYSGFLFISSVSGPVPTISHSLSDCSDYKLQLADASSLKGSRSCASSPRTTRTQSPRWRSSALIRSCKSGSKSVLLLPLLLLLLLLLVQRGVSNNAQLAVKEILAYSGSRCCDLWDCQRTFRSLHGDWGWNGTTASWLLSVILLLVLNESPPSQSCHDIIQN